MELFVGRLTSFFGLRRFGIVAMRYVYRFIGDALSPWEPRQRVAPVFENWMEGMAKRFKSKGDPVKQSWRRWRDVRPIHGIAPVLPPAVSAPG